MIISNNRINVKTNIKIIDINSDELVLSKPIDVLVDISSIDDENLALIIDTVDEKLNKDIVIYKQIIYGESVINNALISYNHKNTVFNFIKKFLFSKK